MARSPFRGDLPHHLYGLKIKIDSVVKNIAVYIMLGVSLEGRKEIIDFWIGEHDTAKYWLSVLNDIKKRGVEDVLIFAIDGLNSFNQAIEAIYPKAEVQRCIVHQIRSSLRFVSWKDRKAVAKDLKGIYTALNEKQALQTKRLSLLKHYVAISNHGR